MKRLAAVLLVGSLFGCPKDEPPAVDQRLVAKLQAEQRRLEGELAKRQAEAAAALPVAEAAAQAPTRTTLKLPGETRCALEHGSLVVTGAEATQQAVGEKVAVATPERFVVVHAELSSATAQTVALDAFTLTQAGERHPMARDAQRVAGTRELQVALAKGARREVTLWFEVPAAHMGPGLALSCPAPNGAVSEVALQ